ncbi:MAG: small ribosomal subunit biogenesis GTPase RsgA [Pleurocapsa sp.]
MNYEELSSVIKGLEEPQLIGIVVAVQANFYRVRLEKNSSVLYLLCTRRTRLKKIGQKVMVGDRVIVEQPDWQDGRGVISKIISRTTEFQRPTVANAQNILLLFAVEEPTLDPWQLSRFLVKAESTSLKLCLCLNKCDLITEKQQQQWQQRLENWGYDPIFISVRQKQGIEELLENLPQVITIVAGPSGVGKSSLIDTLIPSINLRIGEVSGKLQRGRHTTRHVELFELPGGGLLADTPGFNQPDLDCSPKDLAWYFPEARIRLQQGNCQFSDCLHRNEPNCVVKGDWERYEYYLDFLDKAIAHQETQQQIPDEESSLKLKFKGAGKRQYIPKLEAKKYRRLSRKQKHQNLQEIYENQVIKDIQDELEDI